MIKNTFFDVCEHEEPEGSASRRSLSEPAGFRITMKGTVKQDEWLRSPRVSSWADASTDASDDEEQSLPDSFSGTDTEKDSVCKVLPPCPPPAFLRTADSIEAEVWETSTISQKFFWPLTFDEAATHVVTEVKQALEISGLASQVDIVKPASAWVISVRLANDSTCKRDSRDQALSIAQSSLLYAAAKVSSMHILGDMHEPFKITQSGFNAVLGEMKDPAQACVDAYRWGWCRNGNCCASLHPERKMLLSFMFR